MHLSHHPTYLISPSILSIHSLSKQTQNTYTTSTHQNELHPIHTPRNMYTKKIPRRNKSDRGIIKYLQTAKLSFFCNNFKRNLNRNFLMKFNDCLVMTNFLNLILNNNNLTIDVVTQFSQFFSNLDVTY